MPMCAAHSVVGTSGINGDAFYVSPDNRTFVLSDGASGAGKEGKVLMSGLCVRMIKDRPFSTSGLSADEYLDRMIWSINNALIEASQEKRRLIFGTLSVCVVEGNRAVIAAAGDSPVFYLHGDSVARVAKTRKTYQVLIDQGLYTEKQLEDAVRVLPEHMWSMFDTFIPQVVPRYTVEEICLTDGDMIIMCCDGISDYVGPSCIKRSVDANNLDESVSRVICMAKERAIMSRGSVKYDDLTMIVYCH